MRTVAAVLWTLCKLLVAGVAGAHTLNFPQRDFIVRGGNGHALVVFAKVDAVRLGRMDSDGDGNITPAEAQGRSVDAPEIEADFRSVNARPKSVGASCA